MSSFMPISEWRAAFLDLSLDIVRPRLALMGLAKREDSEFAGGLKSLFQGTPGIAGTAEFDGGVTAAAFAAAAHFGVNYANRIRDWGVYIYPNSSPLQTQVRNWRLVVARGGPDGSKFATSPPPFIRRLRAELTSFPPFSVEPLRPETEWEKFYWDERKDLGFSPFEWIEIAVDNYRFLSAASSQIRDGQAGIDFGQVYRWGLVEGAALKFSPETLVSPGRVLSLPPSLEPES
jgi:hypothetical protein